METQPLAARRPASLLARAAPLVVLALGLVGFFALGLDKYLTLDLLRENREVLKAWVSDNGALAVLLFIAAYVVVAAFSLPAGTLLSVTGGFLFGSVFGTAWIVIGATTGSTLLFLVAKSTLGEPLRQRFRTQIGRMEEGFRTNAVSYLMLLRLVPLFPFWLVNLAPAFLRVSTATFVVTTLIGIIPGSFVFASIGNGLNALFEAGAQPDLSLLGLVSRPDFYIPIVGLVALSLIPIVYRAIAAKKRVETRGGTTERRHLHHRCGFGRASACCGRRPARPKGSPDRATQDGGRLPQFRVRAVKSAHRRSTSRPFHPTGSGIRGGCVRTKYRLCERDEARARRHCGHRAQ